MEQNEAIETLIIGAGLTGLTTAARLCWAGKSRLLVLEAGNHIGGQIKTQKAGKFIYETGPNTGTISTPEVAELFEMLNLEPEIASSDAAHRLIWKGNRFHLIPSSLWGGITTPLFSFTDKLRLLGEPFKHKGNNPNETIGDMVVRRLGHTFLRNAVDPFLGGIYAGNPFKLVTRHTLPKLYQLEQNYGSFIRGAIAKAKEPKTERDCKATKQVFSTHGGFGTLVEALVHAVGCEKIKTECPVQKIEQADRFFLVTYHNPNGEACIVRAQNVVTTVPAFTLTSMLPQARECDLNPIRKLEYAPVVEVAIGFESILPYRYSAFGGLIPSAEKRDVLGILFPSDCFADRAPHTGALYTVFMGGTRRPELVNLPDDELKAIALRELKNMLGISSGIKPDLCIISNHPNAIAQYYADSDARVSAIARLQTQFPGLYIGGSIHQGIGMAHRITQATNIANQIINQ